MLEQLSEWLAKKLVRAGVIAKAEIEIYTYGFFQAILLCLNVATTLLLGLLFRRMILCLLLCLAYIPIRINAGGYHASSPMRCYVYSTAIIALLLAILRWFTIPVACSAALFVGSIFLIWKLAPVEAKHDPLDETARRVFKRRTRMLCLAEAVLWLCLLVWVGKTYAAAIALGVWTEACMLLIGVWSNHFSK